jgi:hypothetical protein
MKKDSNPNQRVQGLNNDKNDTPGYENYPESEDIYNVYQEETDINPEDIHQMKSSNEKYNAGKSSENDLMDELPEYNLDIPGSELDDDMENIGSEDEENNYYSLGGDDHNDLEEDHGE